MKLNEYLNEYHQVILNSLVSAPYQGNEFNHKEFYEWVKTRHYPVYFSSYEISDKSFSCIFEIKRMSTYSSFNNQLIKTEKLYSTEKPQLIITQLEMEAIWNHLVMSEKDAVYYELMEDLNGWKDKLRR